MTHPDPNLPQYQNQYQIPPSKTHVIRRFFSDLFRLPNWQKTILTAAFAAVTFGWAHQTYHAFTDPTPPTTQTSSNNPGSITTPDQSTASPGSSMLARWSRRAGASLLIGFIVGWAFRTFLKIMSTITAATVAAFCLLSYFNVMNIDMTSIEKKSTTATAWITDQGTRLRQTAMSHVHSTLGGILGLAMGARKKMRPLS
jgi:uncharacterized membrane protein (Fun14 family)